MMVDDYDVAISLNNRLDASVPFKVRPGKQMLKNMQAQGKSMRDQDYTVEKVFYGGDEGGITCMLQGKATDKELFGASITHLVIDPEHPLAEEVKAYQQQRTRRLFLQDQSGFAAMMGEKKTPKKKKKRGGGFGR
ncbi:hypothetical protein Lepto7375DRAFT_4291 [Leptolyngbya sp. PCC 7375]|nr:hypothetical protein Lepto7375DRAFT_4291 [Leptolyngbya sp. PCC 7375]